MSVTLKVKWNKENFDIQVDPNQPVSALKATLQSLTNVPPDRQKLMCKGGWAGILKDDVDLKSCKLSDGLQVLMMGTADTMAPPPPLPAAGESKSDAPMDAAVAGDELPFLLYPAGLVNTGNTCYMNSVLQSLRYLPDFLSILKQSADESQILSTLNQLYTSLSSSKQAVGPFYFTQVLRNRYPQFGEMRNGRYAQQDADELFNCITNEFHHLSNCFTIHCDVSYQCIEDTTEPVVQQTEDLNKLTCNIQGGTDKLLVNNLHEGIKLGLECVIEKYSNNLARNAQWNKIMKIATLPSCLCIHFVRFYWKTIKDPGPGNPAGMKCKILRPINYPEVGNVLRALLFPALYLFLVFGYV
jgi:ubiquitin carboxyl-terminal hydrolase 14